MCNLKKKILEILSTLLCIFYRISDMASSNNYPVGLKQLDLSHNDIKSWSSLSHSESLESLESSHGSSSLSCYSLNEILKANRNQGE